MKIELSNDQYKTLLTIMYCGEWLLNSHRTDGNKISKETENLEQLIFSFAKEAGIEKWIEYDNDLKKYLPTADIEDEIHWHIDEYNIRQKR